MSLGQIFMGRKPPAGGRTTSVAAPIDGPSNGTRDRPPLWRHRFGGHAVVGEATGLGHPPPDVRLFRATPARTRRRFGPPLTDRHGAAASCRPALSERGGRPPKGRLREPPTPRFPGGVHPRSELDLLRSRGPLCRARRGPLYCRRAQRDRSGIVPGREPEVLQLPEQRLPSEPLVLRCVSGPNPRPVEREVA